MRNITGRVSVDSLELAQVFNDLVGDVAKGFEHQNDVAEISKLISDQNNAWKALAPAAFTDWKRMFEAVDNQAITASQNHPMNL